MSHADDRSQTMGQPHTPKVQTTSPKNGKNGLLWVRWSAIWANPGTRQTRPPTTATFPRNTTDKSPPQQHDVSILRLIGHVVLLGSHLACLGTPFSSARGPAIPSLGNPAHVRNSGLTYGTDGPRAKQKTHTRSFRGGGLRKIGSWAGLQIRVPTRIRIGNEHADRLLTYPQANNLSGS